MAKKRGPLIALAHAVLCYQTTMDFFTTLLGPQCQICGTPVEFTISLCRACQKQMELFTTDSRHCPYDLPENVVAVCRYEGWAQEFLVSQKRQSHPSLLRWMAALLKNHCPSYWRQRPLVWVPPRPLSPLHLVESLSLELRQLNMNTAHKNPLLRGLMSPHPWRKQKQRNRQQRHVASHTMFQCRPLPPEWCGQDFLLLDDVTTTGATIEACMSALKSQGAGHVAALVFAATPRK